MPYRVSSGSLSEQPRCGGLQPGKPVGRVRGAYFHRSIVGPLWPLHASGHQPRQKSTLMTPPHSTQLRTPAIGRVRPAGSKRVVDPAGRRAACSMLLLVPTQRLCGPDCPVRAPPRPWPPRPRSGEVVVLAALHALRLSLRPVACYMFIARLFLVSLLVPSNGTRRHEAGCHWARKRSPLVLSRLHGAAEGQASALALKW